MTHGEQTSRCTAKDATVFYRRGVFDASLRAAALQADKSIGAPARAHAITGPPEKPLSKSLQRVRRHDSMQTQTRDPAIVPRHALAQTVKSPSQEVIARGPGVRGKGAPRRTIVMGVVMGQPSAALAGPPSSWTSKLVQRLTSRKMVPKVIVIRSSSGQLPDQARGRPGFHPCFKLEQRSWPSAYGGARCG